MLCGKRKPIVGIPASVWDKPNGIVFHGNAQQYYDVIVEHTSAVCCTIPSIENIEHALAVLDNLDGVLMGGGYSNIHPSFYGEGETDHKHFDVRRDKSSFSIIRKVIEKGIPLFGICRGMQELNVALGGSLHQAVQDIPGRMDHRADEEAPLEDQFSPAHEIQIHSGGIISDLVAEERINVNSAHTQGINKLAQALRVEASADDGIIEAVSVRDAKGFALAVQFHPEWGTSETPFYRSLIQAFSSAVEQFSNDRVL